jgi:hypothetical protein
VKNRLIYEIYKDENMMNQKSYIPDEQFDFIRRFQIKELFWDTEAESNSNNFRAEVWNNLNMQQYNRITTFGSLSMYEQLDVVKRFKWRELNAARVRKKVKKQVEPFINNIKKGKIMLSNEPIRRDRAPQFSKSKPTLVLVNNRCNLILKTIDAEVTKGDEVCEFVEKRIGLSSRRNFETGCIRDKIIDYLYVP